MTVVDRLSRVMRVRMRNESISTTSSYSLSITACKVTENSNSMIKTNYLLEGILWRRKFNTSAKSLLSPAFTFTFCKMYESMPVEVTFRAIISNNFTPTPCVKFLIWYCQNDWKIFNCNHCMIPFISIIFPIISNIPVCQGFHLHWCHQHVVCFIISHPQGCRISTTVVRC